MAGDFTLKLPASTRNRDHERRLHAAFSGFHIVTEGVRPETGRPLIDHVAISPGLSCSSVTTWGRVVDGLEVSDHEGVRHDDVDHPRVDEFASWPTPRTVPS